MSAQEKPENQHDVVMSELFQKVIDLNENQQKKLLDYAEKLLVEEKREGRRRSCNIPINYAANDRVYSNQILNISANGLFIETERPLKKGEEVIMAFKLEGFDRPLKLRGEVARVGRHGVGVTFRDISPHIEEMIRVIVNRMK